MAVCVLRTVTGHVCENSRHSSWMYRWPRLPVIKTNHVDSKTTLHCVWNVDLCLLFQPFFKHVLVGRRGIDHVVEGLCLPLNYMGDPSPVTNDGWMSKICTLSRCVCSFQFFLSNWLWFASLSTESEWQFTVVNRITLQCKLRLKIAPTNVVQMLLYIPYLLEIFSVWMDECLPAWISLDMCCNDPDLVPTSRFTLPVLYTVKPVEVTTWTRRRSV